MGINNTGTPDTKDYMIGGGVVLLAELNSDDTPKAYRKVGNVPDMTVNVSSELYEHFSTQAGIKVKDMTVILEQNAEMSFTMENVLDFNNLKYFFSGEATEYVNPAVAGLADQVLVQEGTLEKNSYYELRNGTDNGAVLGIDQTNLSIATTNGTPVSLTQDVDYTVDEHNGMVFVKDTAIIDTAISGDEGLEFTLAADADASDVSKLEAQTRSSVTVAIKFLAKHANSSITDKVWEFHKVTLSSDGDLGLITEEVAQAGMTGSIEQSTAYTGSITVYDAEARTA